MTEETLSGKPVVIRNSGADPNEVHISKGKSEQVNWKSEIGEVTVVFPTGGSPFKDEQFVVPANGAKPSGQAIVDPGDEGYKYSVWRDAEELFDPKVFIDN